jgi:hypothetical protein
MTGSSSQEASHRRIAKLNQHLQLNDVKLGLVKSQKMSENRSSLFVGPYLTPFKVILSAITCQVRPFEPAWRCEGESPGIYEKWQVCFVLGLFKAKVMFIYF